MTRGNIAATLSPNAGVLLSSKSRTTSAASKPPLAALLWAHWSFTLVF